MRRDRNTEEKYYEIQFCDMYHNILEEWYCYAMNVNDARSIIQRQLDSMPNEVEYAIFYEPDKRNRTHTVVRTDNLF